MINETIVVARKPLSEKNVALNVLKWGTGGINIDACRVEYKSEQDKKEGQSSRTSITKDTLFPLGGFNRSSRENIQGRFPANIILDEEASSLLNQQVGQEVSRFFYVAKASKKERNLGCEDMEEQQTTDGCIRSNPESARKYQANSALRKNHHPTVKPIKLMEYLIKLVSKEGATILDPFMGSGTTGCACANLNRKFIGIEKEPEYIKIAEARISKYKQIKENKE